MAIYELLDFQLACFETLSDDEDEPFYAAGPSQDSYNFTELKSATSSDTNGNEKEASHEVSEGCTSDQNENCESMPYNISISSEDDPIIPLQQVPDMNLYGILRDTDDSVENTLATECDSECGSKPTQDELESHTSSLVAFSNSSQPSSTHNSESLEDLSSQLSDLEENTLDAHRTLDSCNLDHVVPDSTFEE